MVRRWLVSSVLLLSLGCGRSSIFGEPWQAGGADGGWGEDEDASASEPGRDDADAPPFDGCGDGVIVPGELCFLPQVTFASRIDPCSIDIGDLDDDGHLDVAVPNSDFQHAEAPDNYASVLYGDGRGNLSAPEPWLAGGDFAVGLAIGSFDDDGIDDLAVANQLSDNVGLILSNP